MRQTTFMLLLALVSGTSNQCYAEDDLTQLRHMLTELRSEYDSRLDELERRIAAAETVSANASRQAEDAISIAEDATQQPSAPGIANANTFNPSIGVVLSGTYLHRDSGGSLSGFITDPEAGLRQEGFSIGESELNLKADIDDKFTGSLTLAIAVDEGETGVELEEAFIQTLAIPNGVTITAGRFFSGIGYLNNFHLHADDFADRPLPYQVFLANQYKDDGIQLRWLAPTDFFLELGAEVFRGDSFPAAGAENSGSGAYALHLHLGGDMGYSQSWQAGIAILNADVSERQAGDNSIWSYSGDSDLRVADFVWKWAPNGNSSIRHLKIQGEFFSREERGLFASRDYSGNQQGWYLQGIYQFRRGWTAGYRYDELSADNRGADGTILDDLGRTPSRNTFIVQWANSEFSKLRVQYSITNSDLYGNNQLQVQYLHALGSHGSHQF